MNALTLTSLRQNIFQLADQVLETGEPLIIERNGRRLVLAPERPKIDWENLPRRHLFNGDADELPFVKTWDEAEWGEPDNLA